jgi:hypothetical protein
MLQSKMPVNEGYNPTIYGCFFDQKINSNRRNSQSTSASGHLIFDEMMLKTGVCWRSSNHKACGFVSSNSTLTLTNSIKDMLLQNEDDKVVTELWEESYLPAVYVNQPVEISIYIRGST